MGPRSATSLVQEELKDRGLIAPNALSHQYDVNGSIGGPVVRDTLWFFSSVRTQANQNFIGIQENLNVGNPKKSSKKPDHQKVGKRACCRRHRLQPPRFQEAEVRAAVEDDVIQQSNAHDESCGLELLRYFDV